MPQLVVIAVAGAALWAGYRWLARETHTVKESLQAAEAELRRRAEEATTAQTAGFSDADVTSAGNVDMKQLPKLELDPGSGEYRVKGS
jgi:hypothetical protein